MRNYPMDILFFYGYDIDDKKYYATAVGPIGYLTFADKNEELEIAIAYAVDNEDKEIAMIEVADIEAKIEAFNALLSEEMFYEVVIKELSEESEVIH